MNSENRAGGTPDDRGRSGGADRGRPDRQQQLGAGRARFAGSWRVRRVPASGDRDGGSRSGDRPRSSGGSRDRRGRPARPMARGDDRRFRPSGDRPSYGDRPAAARHGDRPFWRSPVVRGPSGRWRPRPRRPTVVRRSFRRRAWLATAAAVPAATVRRYGDRPSGDRPSYGDRSGGGDRGRGDRPSYGDRPVASALLRQPSAGDRPSRRAALAATAPRTATGRPRRPSVVRRPSGGGDRSRRRPSVLRRPSRRRPSSAAAVRSGDRPSYGDRPLG